MSESRCQCGETCRCYILGLMASPDWDALRESEARGYERCRTAILAVLETMRLDDEVLRMSQAVRKADSGDSRRRRRAKP